MPEIESMGTWAHLKLPSPNVLSAFGLSGTLEPLIGGQGESWLVDKVVLKPTRSTELTEFYCRTHAELVRKQAHLLELGLEEAGLFRVPGPISVPGTCPHIYISDGWTATHFIGGAPDPNHRIRIKDILPAARAFHSVLKNVVSAPHPAMLARSDRWSQADRIAWDEITISDATNVSQSLLTKLLPYLNRLNACKQPISAADYRPQLIHGDLSGNELKVTARAQAVGGYLPACSPGLAHFHRLHEQASSSFIVTIS